MDHRPAIGAVNAPRYYPGNKQGNVLRAAFRARKNYLYGTPSNIT